VVYFLYDHSWGVAEGARSATPGTVAAYAAPPAPPEEQATGILRLEIEPAGAGLQLYVDGAFVGAADDFNGELPLTAGRHTIEMRAPGYEAISLEANITEGRSITYRDTLARSSGALPPEPTPAPRADTAPSAPSTFYFIPGCYMGNVPPSEVELPVGCDLSRLVTRTP